MLADSCRRHHLISVVAIVVLLPCLTVGQVVDRLVSQVGPRKSEVNMERLRESNVLPSVIYDFAESLFRGNDYEAAATQYRLLLHIRPGFEFAQRCKIKMALCYILLGGFDTAHGELDRMLRDESMRPRWDELLLWQAVCFLNSKDYVSAQERLAALSCDAQSEDIRAYASYLLAWTYLSRGDSGPAQRIFATLAACAGKAPALSGIEMKALAEAVSEAKSVRRRSPAAAGVLSACLPGAGHFYCKRYRDGCVAFVLNAAFAGASVESYDKRIYVAGGIASSVALIFYSGTIYGAVNAAHKFNRSEREEFLQDLRRRFGDERSLLIERLYE